MPATREIESAPIFTNEAADALPLIVQPAGTATQSTEVLCPWLRDNTEWVQEKLTHNGALLFRGFDISTPRDFEALARAIDDDLKNEYLGTSPRDGLTDYVFSASELPSYYPIPQHCEMSFTASPPRRVFFCCLEEPAEGSGETPLVDFRKVYADLDPEVRQRFEDGGVRIVRNYSGPKNQSRFDLWQLKGWHEMFLTEDREAVDAQCRREGFEPIWGENESLRLISTQPASRKHPVTGETAWHNHTQVFHLSVATGEYKRIYQLRPTMRNWLLLQFARVMTSIKRARSASDEHAMHCTHLDGSEISDADMEHVRDTIWKNIKIVPWRKGDVVAIDNHSVAHGRLPYQGRRRIAVCWA